MKRPAFQFYPADWRKDVQLRACSLAARGLWVDLMCVMHECEPYGHLTLNGTPMTPAQIVNQIGGSESQVRKLLQELLDNGVARATPEGIIYSKRMCEDERIRNARAAGGKGGAEHGHKGAEHGIKGGRPKSSKGGSETPLKVEPKLPPSSSSSSSSSPPEKKLPPAPRVTPSRPDGVDAQVWGDWLALRKAKRAPVTQTTVEGASAEAAKAGMTLDAFLRVWCRRGSQGLEAAWLKPDEKAMSFRERDSELRRAEVARWTGGILASKPSAEVIEMEAPNAAKRLG